jgi:hypothetical protein
VTYGHLGTLAAQLTDQGDDVWPQLRMRFPAFRLTCERTLAFTSGAELGDNSRLLMLSESPGDLPHHHPRRITRVREVIAVGREDLDAATDQKHETKLLGDEVASEA